MIGIDHWRAKIGSFSCRGVPGSSHRCDCDCLMCELKRFNISCANCPTCPKKNSKCSKHYGKASGDCEKASEEDCDSLTSGEEASKCPANLNKQCVIQQGIKQGGRCERSIISESSSRYCWLPEGLDGLGLEELLQAPPSWRPKLTQAVLEGVWSLVALLHLSPGWSPLQSLKKPKQLKSVTSPTSSRIGSQGEEASENPNNLYSCSLTAFLCPCLAQLA